LIIVSGKIFFKNFSWKIWYEEIGLGKPFPKIYNRRHFHLPVLVEKIVKKAKS
jgi:hypothetical protein